MPGILIVDDDVIISMTLEELLTSMGYDIVGAASSGEEAVEMSRHLNPDLILMDIVLPGKMDGIDAAAKIRAELDIPVIFITGYEEERLVGRAKLVEPFGYILKPFKEHQISATIDIALHKKDMERELQRAHDELERKVEERTADLSRTNELLRREIAERKETDAVLRETENQASAAIKAARGFTFAYDIATGKVRWGGAIEEITGFTPEEFANVDVDNWSGKIHPDDKDEVLSIWQKAIQEQNHATAEYRFLTKKGYLTLSSFSITQRDEEGKAYRLVGILQDITARKQEEEALRNSERELKIKAARLEEINTALKVLLEKRAEDKVNLEEKILSLLAWRLLSQ